jgi:ribosome-associated toxin RatA of RatAB toxin-antitoxin module
MTPMLHEPVQTAGGIESGGRTSVGRIAVSAAACAWMLSVFSAAPSAVDPASSVDVTVQENEGLYTVRSRFNVPAPASIAFAVLTDYEAIPRFMPDVRTSNILERTGSRVIVEQEAVAHVMMFSKRVFLVLEVSECGGAIHFRDRSGKSFSHYAGSWRLTEQDNHTSISYELTAKPAFDVPEFLLKRLLKRDAKQMIERLQAEIAARFTKNPVVVPR